MAIKNELFGSCVEEIFVSVEVEYGGGWLCCGWKYLSCFGDGKAAQDWRWRWVMVPGIGCRLVLFEGG
jgi:hypothetical protein